MKEAKDEDDVVFDVPKKNFASGSPCIKIFRVHLVFGSLLQSRSLVQVPVKKGHYEVNNFFCITFYEFYCSGRKY